jgi:hypothetical protein
VGEIALSSEQMPSDRTSSRATEELPFGEVKNVNLDAWKYTLDTADIAIALGKSGRGGLKMRR